MIKVELINSMGDDLTVSNTARVSFDKWKEEIDNQDAKLINYLAQHEHTSPFRHTAITLRCKTPIWLARQLGKHQVGMSWNEVSRRYVDTDIEFYVTEYRERPEGGIKQGSGGAHPLSNYYQSETSLFYRDALNLYQDMLDEGVAPEQARGILPQNMMTSWVWTGSLLSFFHLWRLRSDGHAQVEAQQFADQVDVICNDLFPISWRALKNAQ